MMVFPTSVALLKMRWGIMGCAEIARKNIRAIKLTESSEIVAIASRDLKKAQKFAGENNLPVGVVAAYGSYEELLADCHVDAVYIPLPTTSHLEWVSKAAIAKKHILLEKPVAVTASEFSAMIEVCRLHNVFLMDGTMFMHHRRFESLMTSISDPILGRISMVRSSFSFNGTSEAFLGSNIRVSASGDPLGCLGDLGWYCIRFGIMIFAQMKVQDISKWRIVPRVASAFLTAGTKDGVPLECEARVGFSSRDSENPWEHVLVFDCSFLQPFRQKAEICVLGRGGAHDRVISLDDFVIPRSENTASFISETTAGLVNHATQVFGVKDDRIEAGCVQQEVRMFENFRTLAFAGDCIQRNCWSELSALTQAVVDACLISMCQRGGEVVPVILRDFA